MSATVPTISLHELSSRQGLDQLDKACREWGLFQLTGHGMDEALGDNLFAQMREFFSRPRDEKLTISRSQDNPWGYYDRERTMNVLDCKQVYDYGPADGDKLVPQWPSQQPCFRDTVLAHYAACEQLGLQLLDAIATNLGASRQQLRQCFLPLHTSFLRLNYYPVELGEAGASSEPLGIHPHTDAGALTVLSVDQVPGLQVLHEGHWLTMEARDDALVINIGDMVQVWSNDRYHAPLHRVDVSKEKPRYSAPFFLNPAYSADYAPLASTVDEQHPARYRSINWGEFRALRALGDYDDYGKEVQIEQYRTGL
jgi:isopenicillin N synthase-like dioxygenase